MSFTGHAGPTVQEPHTSRGGSDDNPSQPVPGIPQHRPGGNGVLPVGLGWELTLNTFADLQASQDPEEQGKIMHAQLVTDNGMWLMAADTPNSMEYTPGSSHSLSLSGEDEAELRGYWDKLVQDGTVTVPLEPAPWGDQFGMCIDRFGVTWMVNIAGSGS
jgi:PhnB protein